MRVSHGFATFGVAVMAALAVLAQPVAAGATAGTVTITGGTLTLVAPTTVGFAATLTGADQNVTSPQSFDVLDKTGTGLGWNLTATSTTFTAGTHLFSNTAVTEPVAPTQGCDASTACTLATTNVSFPYTLPAAVTAPTATKIYNATVNTGLGGQTSVSTMQLAIPAATFAGSYTSTWTYSVVSAP